MQGDSVFADFEVDENNCLYVVRISYDGYGCCHPEKNKQPGVIDPESSRQLIELIEGNELGNPEATAILRGYFKENKESLWEEALEEHGLV